MTYTVELYDAPHRLHDCHVVTCPTGVDAVRAAEMDLAWTAADHADLLVDDGSGAWLYYTTVRAEGGVS